MIFEYYSVKVKWFREEALSGVTISQFLDLPANPTNLHILQTEFEAADRTQFGIVSAFLNRIRGQFHQLKVTYQQILEDFTLSHSLSFCINGGIFFYRISFCNSLSEVIH